MILAAAGLVVSARQWRRYSLLYLLFGYYTVTNVLFHVLTRFRWEIEPFFLIFTALYLVTAWTALRAGLSKPPCLSGPGYRSVTYHGR